MTTRRSLINIFNRSYSAAVRDSAELTNIIKSELEHERNTIPFYLTKNELGSLGSFVLEWDKPESKDVFLRRKNEFGEEIAVSALLGPPIAAEEEIAQEGLFPNTGLMKVGIKKPGLSSILQFDCGCIGKCEGGSQFSIQNAYYLSSSTSLGDSVYKGPLFRTLDPQLQNALKDYLRARGIVEDFTDFLLHHLHKREYVQYMAWLQKLDSSVKA
ncbi:hypothetical protein MKW94_025977 [Papaver nudicaule]|uniref:Mitochondrial glycoprotein n=1 Tax=Papaver nudicaule TaxID=74823 RepID=A0AA41VHQ7_PAPNU|nr:hypothetical protein [Papaver nudicaule]